MHALSGQELVRVWEVGLGQHPLDQALTILTSALPEMSRDKLIALSVGQRDACLLAAREQAFGSRLVCLASCPSCQEKLEFVLDVPKMKISLIIEGAINVAPTIMAIDGYELHFRLPNSLDLAAIIGSSDVVAARSLLVQRCVLQASQDGVEVAAEALPETIITALAAQMEERDPLAEIQIDLDCLACDYHWQILFDIVSFFWTEISAQTKRLLREVHILARAYGWREADILSMSTARRQFYLEMV